MNPVKKHTLWLLLGLVLTGTLVYEASFYKKNHQAKIPGLYKVHDYTVSHSEGAAEEDNTILITVPDDHIIFYPPCYTYAGCQLDPSGEKISYNNAFIIGTIQKTWSGFTSNYTVYETINQKNYSWTFKSEWEKIK
jgi:hypothetical protein